MEKYTSEMIKDLTAKIIGIATAMKMIVDESDGRLSPEVVKRILVDVLDVRMDAILILDRLRGWEYAAFDVILTQEVKKSLEKRIHEDDET